uniref:Mitochondrial ribonuclease P catalytic subunit n=1 Tax=Pelusios castaneus TaxID=367368 RepID=A0A8C8VNT4_9SAUR
MAFVHPTNLWGLQTLWKYHMFWPVSRCQQLFAVIFHLSKREHSKWERLNTTFQSAIPVDSKVTRMPAIKTRSEGKDRETEEGRTGGDASCHPFSLFSTAAANRRSMNQEKRPMISTMDIQPPEKPLSVEEWKELREKYNTCRNFDKIILERMIRCNSSVDVAKSLLSMLAKSEGDISYGVLLKYLALCAQQKQMAEVREVYNIMKVRFKVLEIGAYNFMIKALSDSGQWREALLLLEEIKKVITPSSTTYGNCIKAAIDNRELNLAYELYHEMLAKGLMPKFDTLQVFFDTGKCVKDDWLKNELLGILLFLRENVVYPGEDLILSIKLWFESIPGEKWKGHFTTIQNSGKCSVCNQILESIHLNQKEYNILKEKVMKDLIYGQDVFRKTTPEELEQFKRFLENHPPYDVVIDGLNVSRVMTKGHRTENLYAIVNQLAKQNLRLLILGRKHMLNSGQSWERHILADIKKKADIFFADNLSADDPFLLYATLHSGRHCKFVTNDLLRDHKAALPDKFTRELFFKWQRGHQLVINSFLQQKRRVIFQPVLLYDSIVQTTGDTWHIPYDEKMVKRYSYQVPAKWLCLRRKK